MLLPQTKEREYRFKLALRMGLPIFALILAFISHTLITNYENLQTSFFVEAILLVLVSIYFIFYLIYNGFKVKITDGITNTFTREYFYEYLKKEFDSKVYTLVLVSVENLHDINTLYGLKNGDKVLKKSIQWLVDEFEKEGITNFPIGHIQGGDFLLALDGKKDRYAVFIDMLGLKSHDLKIDSIEVKLSFALEDTSYCHEIEYLLEYLFELQEKKSETHREKINPNELESAVIKAIKEKQVLMMQQEIYYHNRVVAQECFIKLQMQDGKPIFPKTYTKVINKLGLGIEFDLMVLEYIATTAQKGALAYGVNILPTSLRDERFIMRVIELVQTYDVAYIFILSESEYYSYISRYNDILKRLKNYGITFIVDRVGSLHTSFLYLRELDIDGIRFDSYYSKYEKMKENSSIIEGFVTMAHKKGIVAWMKNIEDQQSLDKAQDLGIDYIQGKYLSQLQRNKI